MGCRDIPYIPGGYRRLPGPILGENFGVSSVEREEVRAAEVIGSLSLATDLGIGVPLEHGLLSTLVAVRLADRLGVDEETAPSVFFSCLLFYVGALQVLSWRRTCLVPMPR